VHIAVPDHMSELPWYTVNQQKILQFSKPAPLTAGFALSACYPYSAKGAQYYSQGQALSGAKRVAPGYHDRPI